MCRWIVASLVVVDIAMLGQAARAFQVAPCPSDLDAASSKGSPLQAPPFRHPFRLDAAVQSEQTGHSPVQGKRPVARRRYV